MFNLQTRARVHGLAESHLDIEVKTQAAIRIFQIEPVHILSGSDGGTELV
jgi:hypothetical protein